MDTQHHDQLVFHLTGRCQGHGLSAIAGAGLRPALLAAICIAYTGFVRWKLRLKAN